MVWAIVMRVRYGGKVRIGGSLYGYWPHFTWVFEGRRYEYSPVNHIEGLRFPPAWFEGQAREIISESITRTTLENGELKTIRIEF